MKLSERNLNKSEEQKKGKAEVVLKKIKGAGSRMGHFLKKHKILALILAVILIVLLILGMLWQKKSKKPRIEQRSVETATVQRMDLTNSVSATGTLATAEGKSGSTTLKDIKVTKVYVEVGDEVQEGDIICTFDSSDIENALADAKNNYAVNQKLDALENYETQYQDALSEAEDSLQDARDTRDAYKSSYGDAAEAEENALNYLNTMKSQQGVGAKKDQWETAANDLTEKLQSIGKDAGLDLVITDLDGFLQNITGEGSLNSTYAVAQAEYVDYKEAKKEYESALKAVNDAQSAYDQAKASAAGAKEAYEQAQSNKEKVQEQYDSTVEQAQKTYEKAKLQDQLVTEDDALNKIEDYEEQLEDCTVYASMTGTVTALNVEENNVFAGGAIYEIQDVHNFLVEAAVDEYDVVNLEEGQKAYVKTDSLGDEELEGEVTYVAPVGTSGQTMGSAGGTASYEIQITIKEPQEKLRSGMTASVSIALEESQDTLAVPYDCVQMNKEGQSVIYVDENGERKEIVVETGIETEYYVEVSSNEIAEGMTVYLATPLLQSDGNTGSGFPGTQEGSVTFSVEEGMPGRGGGMPSGGGGMPGGGAPGGF